MNKEKMIVVEKSTKWWLSVVASGSLVVGLLGGYTFGSLTQKATNQQSTVQTSKTQQNNQDGNNMQGPGGQPPQGQDQNNGNGMPPQMNGQDGQVDPGGNGGPGGPGGQPPQGNNNQENGSNSKKKPANADGSTKDKDSYSNQNNEENTTKS